MEAELRGHGLLPEGQSVVDGTAPLYYLTAPPPESTPAFRYSCLGQERYLQRYVPLPAVPASPPRHLDLGTGPASRTALGWSELSPSRPATRRQ